MGRRVWRSAKIHGNAQIGSQDTTSRAYGFVAGADHRLTPDTVIGFAPAGGSTSFGLEQGLGGGTSDCSRLPFMDGIIGVRPM